MFFSHFIIFSVFSLRFLDPRLINIYSDHPPKSPKSIAFFGTCSVVPTSWPPSGSTPECTPGCRGTALISAQSSSRCRHSRPAQPHAGLRTGLEDKESRRWTSSNYEVSSNFKYHSFWSIRYFRNIKSCRGVEEYCLIITMWYEIIQIYRNLL